MPSEEAIKLIRVVLLVAPLWDTKPRILRDRIGRTQGIRFRMIPPIKAKTRMNGRDILTPDKGWKIGGPAETK